MLDVLDFVFLAIGLAVYVAIIFYAGRRALWWLALLVTLPAAIGGLMYLLDPFPSPANERFLFRHFGWLVVGQFVLGALVYLTGRWKARCENRQKDSIV